MASTVEASAPRDQHPTQRFFQYFQLEATALQQQMARLEDLPTIGGERIDAIEHCLGGISRLQKEVQDAASYTTAYDQKMYSEGIKALHEKLDKTREALAPKPKFSFKSIKKNNSAISLNDAAELASQQHAKMFKPSGLSSGESSLAATPARAPTPPKGTAPRSTEPLRRDSLGSFLQAAGVQATPQSDRQHAAVRKMSFASSNEIDISSHTGLHIILPSSASHTTSSGSLINLRRCIVDMSAPTSVTQPFAALTIRDVKSSLLVCGNVSGATHVTGVESSILIVTTGQFRMHECKNCIVYLQINSDPIIEDCTKVRFAPLPTPFARDASGSLAQNKYDKVQDFKWLKSEPSPNWSLLTHEETIPEDVWKEIIKSGPGWNLEDILKAAGVARLASSH